jgi:Abortive infection bacteriophage resistance protein
MGTKSEELFSRLADVENIRYDELSDLRSFYLLSELKKIKKHISGNFIYEKLDTPQKDFKSIDAQISLLRERNLNFSDEEKSKRFLKECQYYRITAYRYPFVTSDDKDRFRDGVDFQDVWDLYIFDRRLRFLVIDAIERIEVALRSRWAHVLSNKYGILAYQDNTVFDSQMIRKTLSKVILESIQHSDQPCITHYRNNEQKIPIWGLCEVLTYGELLSMFNSIKPRKIKNEILEDFELDEKVAASFLNALRIVRNICAHHGRLWNKRLFSNFTCPTRPEPLYSSMNYPGIKEDDSDDIKKEKLDKQKSIYNILVMLVYFVEKIAPQSRWKNRLVDLISSDYACSFLPEMGFPSDWKNRPIWLKIL